MARPTYLQFIEQLVFCVFDSQVTYVIPVKLSLKLSCNLSDFIFSPKLSIVYCPGCWFKYLVPDT